MEKSSAAISEFCYNQPLMSDSEMLAILVFYQFSGYKCFQYYYEQQVSTSLRSYFPELISYERFIALIPLLLPGLYVFLKWRTLLSKHTGWYIIDSKPLPVCTTEGFKAIKSSMKQQQGAKAPWDGFMVSKSIW